MTLVQCYIFRLRQQYIAQCGTYGSLQKCEMHERRPMLGNQRVPDFLTPIYKKGFIVEEASSLDATMRGLPCVLPTRDKKMPKQVLLFLILYGA